MPKEAAKNVVNDQVHYKTGEYLPVDDVRLVKNEIVVIYTSGDSPMDYQYHTVYATDSGKEVSSGYRKL